jgi:hypothetical protein
MALSIKGVKGASRSVVYVCFTFRGEICMGDATPDEQVGR